MGKENLQFEHGYALLIGVDKNKVEKWSLPGVLRDVTELKKVLIDPESCAYPKENVKLLTGTDATREGILDGLVWLGKRVESDPTDDATVIVCYSGHGYRDKSVGSPEYYLIPYDVKEKQIRLSALKAKDFSNAIEELKPRRLLVILDCCHAGGMGVKDIAIPPRQFMGREKALLKSREVELKTLALGKGRAVLCSSSGLEKSYMRQDRKMSIFIDELIKALSGQGPAVPGATSVLVSNLMSHVWWNVPEIVRKTWGEEQNPEYEVSGNFPIALFRGGKGPTKFTPTLEGETQKILRLGMEKLELQTYKVALKHFRRAKNLMPESEKALVFYYLTYLSISPILSVKKSTMNKITLFLIKIVDGNNLKASKLSRLILGIIWYDYYDKNDDSYQKLFFRANTRYLGNYQPSYKEKQLMDHINCSETAQIIFNLVSDEK